MWYFRNAVKRLMTILKREDNAKVRGLIADFNYVILISGKNTRRIN